MNRAKRKSTTILVLGVSLLFVSTQLFAARPLGTEDAGVGAVGEVVLETAWERATEEGETSEPFVAAIVLGLGRGEVGVEGPYLKSNSEDEEQQSSYGYGDLTFFGKVLLLGKSEAKGMFTLKAEATSTTGDEEKGLGSGKWEYGGSAVFSRSISLLTFHFQGGYTYLKNKEEEEADSYFYGAAVSLAVHKYVSLVGEITGSYNTYEKPGSVTGGIVISPMDMLALDAGVSKGITEEADDTVYTAGLTLVY